MRTLLLSLGLGLGLGLGLVACSGTPSAKTFPFEPSSVTPAATGKVTTATGPNENTKVTVNVKHLAPPDRVPPDATVYVVRATGLEAGATPRNLGALRVDADLNGKLESVTPLRSFDLTVTAEATPTAEEPHGTPC